MEFRTKIDIQPSLLRIHHQSRLMMFGSCFSQSIGNLLSYNKFEVNVNPFGILYNPSSISNVVRRIIDKSLFEESDLQNCDNLYLSFLHHGSFSSLDKDECLSKINASLDKAASDLQQADTLLITFGTAYVFHEKASGDIVSNCHKFSASMFERKRISVDDIVTDWTDLITKLREQNPKLNILFTVSPIRHWKDGAHDNQLSKSTLLLAIEGLQNSLKGIYYFPSYEVLMDELRDYRFYAEDMLHPNQVAIDYIWQLFGKAYFDDATFSIIAQWGKIQQSLTHKPFNRASGEYKQFLRQTLLKLEAFSGNYPYLNSEKEKSFLEDQLVTT